MSDIGIAGFAFLQQRAQSAKSQHIVQVSYLGSGVVAFHSLADAGEETALVGELKEKISEEIEFGEVELNNFVLLVSKSLQGLID